MTFLKFLFALRELVANSCSVLQATPLFPHSVTIVCEEIVNCRELASVLTTYAYLAILILESHMKNSIK